MTTQYRHRYALPAASTFRPSARWGSAHILEQHHRCLSSTSTFSIMHMIGRVFCRQSHLGVSFVSSRLTFAFATPISFENGPVMFPSPFSHHMWAGSCLFILFAISQRTTCRQTLCAQPTDAGNEQQHIQRRRLPRSTRLDSTRSVVTPPSHNLHVQHVTDVEGLSSHSVRH